MTKLVIFDLDGTVLDTLDDLHAGVNHANALSSNQKSIDFVYLMPGQ